jgi:hypothetical protein
VRQGIAMLGSLLNPFRYLLADGLLVLTTFWLVQTIWIERIRGGKPFGIPFAGYAILLYTFCVLATAAFAGLYQKKITDKRVYTAAGFALISLLAAYSLLPESLRYSRGVVLIGCVTGIAAMIGWRKIWLKKSGNKVGIISRKESYSAITNLLEQNLFPAAACRYIAPETMFHPGYQLSEQLNTDAIGTLVISLSVTCRLDQATPLLPALHQSGIRVLWHDENSVGFVGSEPCKPGAQDIAPYCPYQLQNPYQRCMKRLGDLCRSFLFFLCTPYLLLRGAKGRLQLSDAWLVFTGKRCFTGYIQHHPDLPPLKPAIKPHPLRPENKDAASVLLADRQYAANYDWWVDLLHS